MTVAGCEAGCIDVQPGYPRDGGGERTVAGGEVACVSAQAGCPKDGAGVTGAVAGCEARLHHLYGRLGLLFCASLASAGHT